MLRWYTTGPLPHKEQCAAAPCGGFRMSYSQEMPSTEPSLDPQVVAVNVGLIREVTWRGTTVHTGIWKEPVGARAVALRGVNLDGDDQADRRVHGGPDKAVYAYAEEDYRYWTEMEGVLTQPGLFGENLTLRGVELRSALVGERWRVGTALLEVAQPRLPCFKLGIRMGDPYFPKRFLSVARPGAYLRIIEEGELRAGDTIDVVDRPDHGVTLGHMMEAVRDRRRAAMLLRAPRLPAYWRRLASGDDV
jgi:MOSC domain-containing protein YiiM